MAGLPARRVAALLAAPVLVIACAVFVTATIARDSGQHAYQQQSASQHLLTAMLDEETGARGYFETHQSRFLAPYWQGRGEFAAAMAASRALDAGDAPLQELLSEQGAQHASWLAAVEVQVARLAGTGHPPTVAQAEAGKAAVDGFRQLNSLYAAQLAARRNAALVRSTWLAVGLAALLSLLLVIGGTLIVRRYGHRERLRQRRQQELRELLQVSASEEESQGLLIRHVERVAPGAGAAVLNRNKRDDRLELHLSETAEQTPLRDLELEQLHSRSCLAIRLSRPYTHRPGEDSLLRCQACGKIGAPVLCEPLLVGGQVIGSVLMAREQPFGAAECAGVHESAVQAAPILANQRNLALAERRAASDALTGLPNRRSADETVKRMVAHAGRTVTPLAVILLDLDHFKQLNDIHGHERGDHALATVGQILASSIRASDFAARYGGEEFLLLLPDTDRGGAVEVAEKLRGIIERAEVTQGGTITASFGVAALPDDAVDPEHLLRKADRALYAAKAGGRNRVEVALPTAGPDLPGAEPPSPDRPAG